MFLFFVFSVTWRKKAKSRNESIVFTWVCHIEVLVPILVVQLFHQDPLVTGAFAHQLHYLGVLKIINLINSLLSLLSARNTLINGFKFFSLGLDFPPSTAIGYFLNVILEWPENIECNLRHIVIFVVPWGCQSNSLHPVFGSFLWKILTGTRISSFLPDNSSLTSPSQRA